MKRACAVIIAVLISNTAFSAGNGGVTPVISFVLDESCADVSTVTSPTGRVWMDRNLGASRVAMSKDDSAAYGDLYQWGRLTDGHQLLSSNTRSNRSTSPVPGHPDFIITPTQPYNWIDPANNNLWQGVNSINNPCPLCFRLATNAEWDAEITQLGITNSTTAFNSLLKLVVGGTRERNNGNWSGDGSIGTYWSSDFATSDGAYYYSFSTSSKGINHLYRAYGRSVRCIKQ